MREPKWEQYTRDTIGESLWQKLSSEDKAFLIKASHMFDLGKKGNIKRILRSLNEP